MNLFAGLIIFPMVLLLIANSLSGLGEKSSRNIGGDVAAYLLTRGQLSITLQALAVRVANFRGTEGGQTSAHAGSGSVQTGTWVFGDWRLAKDEKAEEQQLDMRVGRQACGELGR